MFPFNTPENTRKLKVFWYFNGKINSKWEIGNGKIGQKLVKSIQIPSNFPSGGFLMFLNYFCVFYQRHI